MRVKYRKGQGRGIASVAFAPLRVGAIIVILELWLRKFNSINAARR